MNTRSQCPSTPRDISQERGSYAFEFGRDSNPFVTLFFITDSSKSQRIKVKTHLERQNIRKECQANMVLICQ